MKKFLFAILACTIALGFTSCREKKAKDKVKDRVENVKESVEDALEEAQEQIEEGAVTTTSFNAMFEGFK